MTKIKICGLRREEDIEAVNRWKPDYIGFVFAEKSKRCVTAEQAEKLKQSLDKSILSVGVFVNQPLEFLITLAERHIIDAVQLHGSEDADYLKKLKENVSCPIIRSVSIKDSLPKEPLPENADFLLFDTASPQNGGSGESFDWNILNPIKLPYFLAGGIDENNAEKAIAMTSPYCIDVSSGVETDGWKDEIKIKKLIKLVRGERYI